MNAYTPISSAVVKAQLARMSTDDLVVLGEAIRDALFARVLNEYADECEESRIGIGEDLAFMAKRTAWVSL